MDTLIIYGAKYLWVASVVIALFAFYKSEDKSRFFKFGVLLLPISYIVGLIARSLYYNPRPFVVGNFSPLIEHAADNGFPSDHTLLVATLAAMVSVFDKKAGILLWFITLIVAASRVFAGVHHWLDVLGSIAISGATALVIYFLNNKKKNAANNTTDNKQE